MSGFVSGFLRLPVPSTSSDWSSTQLSSGRSPLAPHVVPVAFSLPSAEG